jgi:hypothetical protein
MNKRDKRDKRGQLTLFVFMGIVIVISIFLYYFLNDSKSSLIISPEINPVYESVNFCLSDVTKSSIYEISFNGGYFNLPNESNDLSLPYYFKDKKNLMPSKEVVESEISNYVREMGMICIKKELFNLQKYDVTYEEMNVETKILEDDTVEINILFPFNVYYNENTYRIDKNYNYVYNERLFTIYSFVESIIKEHEIEPRAVCINCLGEDALEKNLFVDMWSFDDTEVIYYVSDVSKENSKPLTYFFVIKYPVSNNYDPFENF